MSIPESRRQIIIASLLVALVLVLIFEIVFILPSALQSWHPFDYWQYTEMGKTLREGNNPFSEGRYYPLPTILWIFVPLSSLPDWFRFVWILGSFISCLILFRKQGIWLFLFIPLWFVIGDGMLDGWLLVPLAWLLANRPYWAGLGGAIVLFKPQLAILTVGYSVVRWIIERDWKNLGTFAGAMFVFYLPSFLIDPNWVSEMLAVLPDRAAQTTTFMPLMGGSLWSWWWLGIIGQIVLGILSIATLFFAIHAFGEPSKRVAVIHLLGLLFTPILFGSNQVMALPTLRSQRDLVVIVLISFGAYFLGNQIGIFGGGYALIPLAALYLLTRDEIG